MDVYLYLILFSAIVGLIIGSYLTCVTWRIPNHMSIGGRSICPSCGKQLKNIWNVPVLSYLFLKGRSGCCNQKISFKYPLIEIISMIAFIFIGLLFGIIAVLFCVFFIIIITFFVSVITLKINKK